ncbi:Lrp/AsnC family transcriptional regulator [Algimonas porphyrae]|uniref:AsnC family transcriptional regulator n=1 Tax=Algimonas porphyrae TaxID=1128113 RepID=A0ABQ5V393_9PROT|nr:Lrp/AsnC family transcriptional regulator [Algimonas porphyrae]GLQ21993.1 AsnC family transcriptional regulator [Algimonas porphyrae]
MIEATDRKILSALQMDSRRSAASIGETVGLSASACHRRIRLLEDRGVIEGYGARLNAEALGYTVTFFVEVSLEGQSEAILGAFEGAADARPEVLECYLTTGNADYVLKVAALDTEDFERIHRRVISGLPHVTRIQSSLVMKTVKRWRGYPVR